MERHSIMNVMTRGSKTAETQAHCLLQLNNHVNPSLILKETLHCTFESKMRNTKLQYTLFKAKNNANMNQKSATFD